MTFPLKNNVLNEGKGSSKKRATWSKIELALNVRKSILDNMLHCSVEMPLQGKGGSGRARTDSTPGRGSSAHMKGARRGMIQVTPNIPRKCILDREF